MPGNDHLITTDNPLPQDSRDVLRSLVPLLIIAREEHAVPGAGDDAIFADILTTARAHESVIIEILQTLSEISNNLSDADFIALPEDDRLQVTVDLRREHPLLVSALVAITAQCYYRDDRVMQSLGMAVRPPYPQGFTLEQGDWSLLDPVRKREKFYRVVPPVAVGTD